MLVDIDVSLVVSVAFGASLEVANVIITANEGKTHRLIKSHT